MANWSDENILQKDDLFQLCGGTKNLKNIKRILYGINECLPPMEVVERATALLEGRASWEKFNVFTNNCEHFATYCKTGEAKSKQIEKIEELLNSFSLPILYCAKKSSPCFSLCC